MIKHLLWIFSLCAMYTSVQAQYVSTPVNTDSRTLNTSYLVGSIPGSLTASSSGNSNYQIPIEVPPGVNGLVPNLSINYNSASSNGLLGYGVSLSGISYISRGANSFMQDGNSKKVDFNTSDALYLGGSRLILVSGTYGAANSEYRLDNSNRVRIRLYGSGTSIYFIVNMPNGRVYEYGSSSNSRLTDSSGILRWYVKSISDNDGNSIQYGYIYNGNGFKISQILYAGNVILFTYTSRDDKIRMYFAGTGIVQKEVLSKVLVLGQGSRFREYQFSYFKNIYSYLNEIKVLGTDGTQLNSTVLNWGESNDHSKYSTTVSKNTHIREYGDFNGDGRIDFIQYPNKSSYTSSDTYQIFITSTDGKSETSIKTGALNSDFKSFQVLDYNGDLQDDILKMGYGAFGYSYYYWGYSSGSIITLASYFDDTRTAGSIKFIGADLNGDNIKNTIVLEKTLKWTLKRVDGLVATNFPSISSPTAEFFAHKFDNNNSEDIFIKSGDNLSVYELDPTDSKFKELYSASIFAGSTDYEFVDFNGDGIVDLLDNTNNKLHYGTGKGFYESTYPVVWDNSALIEKYRKVLTGDFNGDGLTDIYQVSIVKKKEVYGTMNYSEVYVHYSTGEGFIKKIRLDLRPFGLYDYTVSETLSAVSIQDFNGDNLDDVICAYDASSKFQKLLSNDSGNETYLTKIADGMNNKYAITYQRTNDGDVYSQDASTGDSNLSYYQGKMKMVKGISMTSDKNERACKDQGIASEN